MPDWSGEDYAQVSALQEWLANESLKHLQMAGHERILDVGCGDGRITERLAKQVPTGSVLGIDASPKMVEFAQTRHASDRLQFLLADARTYQFADPFDLIVSFNALHWVRSQTELGHAFQAVAQALKPQGRAHLRFVPAGPLQSLEDVLEEVRQRPRWRRFIAQATAPFTHAPPERCRQLAEAANLEVCGLDCTHESWDFGSRESFRRFGEVTFVEWTGHLPLDEQPDFIEQVLDSYSSDHVFRFYQLKLDLKFRG